MVIVVVVVGTAERLLLLVDSSGRSSGIGLAGSVGRLVDQLKTK